MKRKPSKPIRGAVSVKLTPQQSAFHKSPALYRGFCGGRGSGKTTAGAIDLLQRATATRGLYMAASPTFGTAEDVGLRSVLEWGRLFGVLKHFHKSDLLATLASGSEILFRSTDNPDRLRGPNLLGLWLDEASLMPRQVFDIGIASLRDKSRMGWLSATFTPRGRQHWTFEVFGQGRPDTFLVQAATACNTFLPMEFVSTLRAQYGFSAWAEQELGGEFRDLEGSVFSPGWFPVVEYAPGGLRSVRAWDLAATAPRPGRDPDWTVGVLIGKTGTSDFFILDVRRLRAAPRDVELLIHQTAAIDGYGVTVVMEQEPGSAGVTVADHFRRLLAGHAFDARRSTGDKVTRALPLASLAQGGLVRLVRAPWNKDFLDEVQTFPNGRHDDQIDAAAAAVNKLAFGCPGGMPTAGPPSIPAPPAGAFAAKDYYPGQPRDKYGDGSYLIYQHTPDRQQGFNPSIPGIGYIPRDW